MSKYRQEIGKLGEDYAISHLKKTGYKVLERNYRSARWGEIDIVAIEDKTLVFIEVKTRLSTEYGDPVEAVTPNKLRVLKRTGTHFKLNNPKTPDALRIDVITIKLDSQDYRPTEVNLFKNVAL